MSRAREKRSTWPSQELNICSNDTKGRRSLASSSVPLANGRIRSNWMFEAIKYEQKMFADNFIIVKKWAQIQFSKVSNKPFQWLIQVG
jgi:hypothetical protein